MDIIAPPKKIHPPSPQRRKMNYEDYLKLDGDSKIIEWVKGEVITYRPPQYQHQNILSFLGTLLKQFVELFNLGLIIYAPFEVKLWSDGPSREPDIIFIATKNIPQDISKRFEGAPDLVIEIVSPSSVTEDRVRKFAQYEKAGVQEYWVIDPRPHQQQADFYHLGDDGQYYTASVDENGIYHSTVIPHFWFELNWLWQKKLPDPQGTFAQIILSTPSLPPDVRIAYETIQNWLGSKK